MATRTKTPAPVLALSLAKRPKDDQHPGLVYLARLGKGSHDNASNGPQHRCGASDEWIRRRDGNGLGCRSLSALGGASMPLGKVPDRRSRRLAMSR
jgi:hypothetical protein